MDLGRRERRVRRLHEGCDGRRVRGRCRRAEEWAREASYPRHRDAIGGRNIRLVQDLSAGRRKVANGDSATVAVEEDSAWTVRTKRLHHVARVEGVRIGTRWLATPKREVCGGGCDAERVGGGRGGVTIRFPRCRDRQTAPVFL